MSGLSRRSFLSRTSLALATGAAVTAVPGVSSLLEAAQVDAPEIEGGASETEAAAADVTGPLIAHVRDLRTGEIGFYEGEREVVLKDPGLATRLYRASR